MRPAALNLDAGCTLAVARRLQLGHQRGLLELADGAKHLPNQHGRRRVRQEEVRCAGRYQLDAERLQVVVAGELHDEVAGEPCQGFPR